MKHNYKRSAYAGNAHGGQKRATGIACKMARSANSLLRGIGRGLVNAVRAWTDSAPVKGGW